jgi:hypothetical protein
MCDRFSRASTRTYARRVRNGNWRTLPFERVVGVGTGIGEDKLVPKSLKVLDAHLGEGNDVNPDAWRAALRVFEHAYGRAPEQVDEGGVFAGSADEIAGISWVQLRLMAAQLAGELPDMAGPAPIMAVSAGSKVTGSPSS